MARLRPPSRLLLAAVAILLLAAPGAEAGGSSTPAALRARFDALLTPEQRAELAFLEHEGWRIVPDAKVPSITIQGGRPCDREDLAAAHAAGDLQILVPPSAGDDDIRTLGERLPALADSIPTRCAHQLRLAPAVAAATRKLSENTERGWYIFPQMFMFDSLTFKMLPPEPEWVWDKWLCVAKAAPSDAISSFYDRRVTAECYVGQWIALYAIQYEVFGEPLFDEAFRPEEFTLGRPGDQSEGPIGKYVLGDHSQGWRVMLIPPSEWRGDMGLTLARHGPQAFVGASGVVENVQEDLDTNDNMVIVSVSRRANQLMLDNGGFAYLQKLTERIWEIHRTGRRGYTPGASGGEAPKLIAKELEDPIFSEIMVYVHPYGVVPLGEVVEKRIGHTHRPMKVRLYDNGVADFFYRRYHDAIVRRVLAGEPIPPATVREPNIYDRPPPLVK